MGKYITIPINDSLDLVCLSVCVVGVITVDTLTYCQILSLIHYLYITHMSLIHYVSVGHVHYDEI